jgi:polyphosphate kinase 2
MGKHKHHDRDDSYAETLHDLQVELVKYQRHLIAAGDRVLVILEGRDAAGKDGTIKHIIEHLSPRDTRVVALSKPSDRESGEWYFQRYAQFLPSSGEFVLFNRSWYNRAGVERVMGFCTDGQYEEFMRAVPSFEALLIESGLKLFKFWLDIDKKEQKARLADRRKDPLKQWKISPIDEAAQKHWKDYSQARDEMLARTHAARSPWTIARSNDKHAARLNVIRWLLAQLDYDDKRETLLHPDPDIVFPYELAAVKDGRIAP